jgi:uncharacterized repeat protein (TIGR01451 family)
MNFITINNPATGTPGYYQFTGLCNGTYSVSVNAATVPTGFESTFPLSSNGNDGNGTDSNQPAGTTVTLTNDSASNETIDFGYISPCTGSIGDFVWQDLNHNGIQDDGAASGINGVQVLLTGTNVYGQPVSMNFITINNPATGTPGYYQFTGLCQGSYTVSVNSATVPASLIPTSPLSANGNDLAPDDSNNPIGTTLTLANDSSSNQTIDFGYVEATPKLTVTKSCTDALAPGQPIYFSATVTNTGNEPLTGLSCNDVPAATLSGVPSTLAVGASATVTGSYVPSCTPSTHTSTCSGHDGISHKPCSEQRHNHVQDQYGACDHDEEITHGCDSHQSGDQYHCGQYTGHCDKYKKPCVPSCGPFTDTLTCTATGAISNKPISNSGSATCKITTTPAITVTKSCTDASGAGQPINFTATVTNTGQEALTGLTCTDVPAATLSGVPSTLAAGASATVTGSYVPSGSPSTDTLTCSGTGAISKKSVSSSGSATCKITSSPKCNKGDTATIGFWHNKNGQALIQTVNGGPSSSSLANWLASNFPYLYGTRAGTSNLSGKNNSDVAALFLKFFSITGQKTDAQILGGALACYVTSSSLAGNVASRYGFNVSQTGTGAKTYNVGSYGSAIGLTNNTSYTVFDLLRQADLQKKAGTFNANAFNSIFDGINQIGDI